MIPTLERSPLKTSSATGQERMGLGRPLVAAGGKVATMS